MQPAWDMEAFKCQDFGVGGLKVEGLGLKWSLWDLYGFCRILSLAQPFTP